MMSEPDDRRVGSRYSVALARAGALALAGLLLSGTPGAAKRPRPEACPPGRFLVVDGGLLASLRVDAVEVAGTGQIAMGACGPMRAKLTPRARFTRVVARWPRCGDLRQVRLKGRIEAPDCSTLSGRLGARQTPATPITAVRSACGDGRVDPATEECDTAPCVDSSPCTSTCTCAAATPGTTTTSSIRVTSTSTTSTSSTVSTIPSTTTTSSTSTTSSTVVASTTSTTSTSSTTTTSVPTCRPPAASSAFVVTSTCLTAGTGARLAAILTLVDEGGDPVPGADVTFTASNPDGAWLEPAVVEAPSPPGTYRRTMQAPVAAGSTTVTASATWCGTTRAITAMPAVTFAAPAPAPGTPFEGVGGCAPIDGHVRVRVVEAETGLPIAGASVLVGASEGTPFVASPGALFPAPVASGANVATTDEAGVAEFLDFGDVLTGSQVVTAGAPGRAYETLHGFDGADQVLALPLRRPTRTRFPVTAGTATSIPSRPNCTWLQLGIVAPDLTLAATARLDQDALSGPRKCVDTGIGGIIAVPENWYLPAQTLGTTSFLCLANVTQSPWSLSVDAGARVLAMSFLRLPVATALSAGDLAGAVFQEAGFAALDVSAPVSGEAIALGSPYPASVTFDVSGAPAMTDLQGTAYADLSGADGTGPLAVDGVATLRYSDAGSLAVPVGTLGTAPAGARRLGAVTARFVPPIAPRAVPADLAGAASTVLVRRGAGGEAPFGSAANASIAVDDLLGLAPAAIDPTGTIFTFGDTAVAGSSPEYSVSTLAIRHTVWRPQLACESAPSQESVSYPQWIVVRPHSTDAATCAALSSAPAVCEGFTLPILPPSFPQATSGVQQQAGLEPYVGSGMPCAGSCVFPGEVCQVPAGSSLPAQCMGTDGAASFTEAYEWTVESRVLGQAPGAVSAAAADLTQWAAGLTHVSSNVVRWP